ncbi:MAG: Holliday junction branch migration protein RuvA [Chloroflexi bacterium]|nr:MAG: Holliday junction branch migration protein RuvA [Chloroflexota bacterium]
MIATLRGTITAVGTDYLIVETGGIGWRVMVPSSVVQEAGGVGQPITLFTHLVVRENELSLYGCSSLEMLEFFQLLLEVSGVGPRLALAILSALSPDAVRQAVLREQPEMLTRVPGVGRKTARRIVFQLKEKLAAEEVPAVSLRESDTEVIAALTALGYSVVEAQMALQSLPDEEMPLEERIRRALAYFAAQGKG